MMLCMRNRRLLLLSLLLCTGVGCAPSSGSMSTDPRHAGQVHICENLGQVAANISWTWMAEGKSLDQALDALDTYYAKQTSSAAVQSARDMRRATRVIYAHPDWTQSQAALGVTQDCLRSSIY
jgi:hypothetical protein